MSSGYLTLDLRELKDTISTLYKKGIYNYILNTNKPIEILISQGAINEFLGSNKGVLCKTFRVNLTELLENSNFGVTEQGLCLPIGYHENHDEVKDVYSIGYDNTIKCVITPNDEIFLQEI